MGPEERFPGDKGTISAETGLDGTHRWDPKMGRWECGFGIMWDKPADGTHA